MSTYIKQAASRIKLHKYASAAKCVRRQRTLEKYAYLMKFAEEKEEADTSSSTVKRKLEEQESEDSRDLYARGLRLGSAAGGATMGGGLGTGGGYLLAKLLRAKDPERAALLSGLGGAAAGGIAGYLRGASATQDAEV